MLRFKYYLFMFVCYLTHPFRLLMPWWKDKHFNFAARLLFNKSARCKLVYSVSSMETNKFKSNLCVNYNNYFGMGYSQRRYERGYQKGAYYSPMTNEPTNRAVYTSVYQSVFDYYVCIKENYTQAWYTMQNVGAAASSESERSMVGFAALYATHLKDGGYFTGTSDGYYRAVEANFEGYENPLWRFILCLVYTIFVPSVIICILARVIRN